MARLFRNFAAIAFSVVALTLATGATAFAGGTMQTPTTGQPGAPTNTCGAANFLGQLTRVSVQSERPGRPRLRR